MLFHRHPSIHLTENFTVHRFFNSLFSLCSSSKKNAQIQRTVEQSSAYRFYYHISDNSLNSTLGDG